MRSTARPTAQPRVAQDPAGATLPRQCAPPVSARARVAQGGATGRRTVLSSGLSSLNQFASSLIFRILGTPRPAAENSDFVCFASADNPTEMDGSALVWTLNGQPAQKVELHMGDSAAAATWASESGGGVTVSVAKALPKPSLPPAQWLGNKAKQAIQVAVPLYPTASNRGSSGVYAPPDAPGLLAKAYTGALSLAAERDLRRIALPALGCAGRHGWPAEKAARLAVRCCVLGAITAQMTTIAFFLEDPDSANAWIAAVQEEVSAGTLAEEAPPEPEEDRAPGWRFRLAERRQREAEEEAEAARAARVAAKKAQLQPEPEPEPDADQEPDQDGTGAAPQNPDMFVDDSSDEDEDEDEDEGTEHDAEEGEHDAEDFIAAAPLVAVLQPAATSAAVAPPLATADDPDGSTAFTTRLSSLADDPMQVELALMARRYYQSWRVLRTQPDLTVSFLFVPSDPDFLPVFRKRLRTMTESAGAGADSNLSEIGLSLELTLPEDYPSTAARIAVSGPAGIPAAHRDAVANLAQDFLTAELIEDSPAQQREGGGGAGGGGDGGNSVNGPSKRRRRPGLRAMVRHLDRQISTAWEEAEEEVGRPKVKIAWVDAPAEHDEQTQQQAQSSSLDDDEDDEEDEVLVELWDPERHAVFQDALKAVGKETKGDAKWEAVAAGMAERAANTPSVSGAVIAAASAPECKAYFSLVKQHIKLKKKRAERAAKKAQRQQQREQEGESAETAKPPATMSPQQQRQQQQQQQQQQQRSTTAALRVSLQGLELQGLVVLHAVRMLLRVSCKRCKTVAEATLSEVRVKPSPIFFALPFLGVETILAETGSGQTEGNLREEVVCSCPCRTPLGQHRAPSAAQRWTSCSRRNCAMW
eukprot:COSAG06_NODE_281_length_18447_cov_14.060116_8_plen_871_part_00